MRAIDDAGWSFPTPRPNASNKGCRDRIGKSFARVVKAAGLDPTRIAPHNMRHTAVSKLGRSGVDLVTVQAIFGHKSMQMVLRYAKKPGAAHRLRNRSSGTANAAVAGTSR